MSAYIVVLVIALVAGLAARAIRLPPLVGFLVAGFIMNATGVQAPPSLEVLSELGVTLLLFTIGLHFDARSLLRREVWGTATLHMALTTPLAAGILGMVAMLFGLGGAGPGVLVLLGFAVSFSSTVLVMKELDARNDESSFYGTIAIGILLIQDVAAVFFLTISAGEPPKLWALGLVVVLALVWASRRLMVLLGHGEMLVLYGVVVALVPGWYAFEWVGLKGDLGALVMGLLLAGHLKSGELARLLFGMKELLLVGFFLSIGLHGLPTLEQALAAALFVALVAPVKMAANVLLLRFFTLSNRSSVRIALVLGNFSEFGIIVAAVGAHVGWLAEEWLVFSALAVAMSMVLSTTLNRRGSQVLYFMESLLPTERRDRLHPGDAPIDLGRAQALVLGMGRTGRGAYDRLDLEMAVVGVESDETRAAHLTELGYEIIRADATDRHFWERVCEEGSIELVIMAMPAHGSQEYAQRMLTASQFNGVTAAVAQYPDDARALRELGVDTVMNLYEGAGEQLVDLTLLNRADQAQG